jgi:hypothetical protein
MKVSMRNQMKVSTRNQKLTHTTLLSSAVGVSTSISAELSPRLATNPEEPKAKTLNKPSTPPGTEKQVDGYAEQGL